MIGEHLRDGQLDCELDECDQLREPPVRVTARLMLNSAAHDGLLSGWASNPKAAMTAGAIWWATFMSTRAPSKRSTSHT